VRTAGFAHDEFGLEKDLLMLVTAGMCLGQQEFGGGPTELIARLAD
jgi:hypothetical protein